MPARHDVGTGPRNPGNKAMQRQPSQSVDASEKHGEAAPNSNHHLLALLPVRHDIPVQHDTTSLDHCASLLVPIFRSWPCHSPSGTPVASFRFPSPCTVHQICHASAVSRLPFPMVDATAPGPFWAFSFSSNLANSCIAISSS